MKKELLIGCGNNKTKQLVLEGHSNDFENLVTLDISKACNPDVVHDLEQLPLPFADNEFDEIHAYEVLEHTGQQGDVKFFFAQFQEFWRILKPGGLIIGSTPAMVSPWLWGDPGHKRVILAQSLVFLDREEQDRKMQDKDTPMTDYRHMWTGNFKRKVVQTTPTKVMFALEAVK